MCIGPYLPYRYQIVRSAFAEHILTNTAQGALEILGKILELRTGSNASLGVALRLVVNPAANIANILLHMGEPP